MTAFDFSGVLFFPVTPFSPAGTVDHTLLRDHVASGVAAGAGGVFAACGTGEFHALDADEASAVVATAVDAVAGAVPTIAGSGGPLGHALRTARAAAEAGADGLLILPPYLVGGPQDGLRRYVEAIVEAADLPVIVYHRASAQFTPNLMRTLVADPRIVGFKDGVGDIARAQEIVAAVSEVRSDVDFFNGLLTAELSQGAYRGIGIPLYSSAAFAMAPTIANAYYRAYIDEDEAARLRLIREFYSPLVALRDETPGFGVSLIKAGLRERGIAVGSVRAPLADPTPDQTRRLRDILDAGERVALELSERQRA